MKLSKCWRMSQSELTARGDSQKLRMALHRADEVISTAGVTETVRRKIWNEVKSHAILSEREAQDYESARQECLIRQAALNELEGSVNAALHDYYQLIEHSSSLNQCIPPSRPNSPKFSHSLRPYNVKMVQTRLSKENIHHQIQCEGGARIIYQNLTKELMQKPAVEKMAEDVQKVKYRLQRRAEKTAEKTDHYRRQIIQQTRFAIEHGIQVKVAHAHRIEQLSLSLAAIIQLLQSDWTRGCRPLLNLMAEAQALQKDLHEKNDSVVLQEKLLVMNAHRCAFGKSITSFWGTLFINRHQLQQKRQFNQDLQSRLAHLVTPICGFNDKNKAMSHETVKKLKITSAKLAIQQERLTEEEDKINQIKIPSRMH